MAITFIKFVGESISPAIKNSTDALLRHIFFYASNQKLDIKFNIEQ